jgi:hypothetical protein
MTRSVVALSARTGSIDSIDVGASEAGSDVVGVRFRVHDGWYAGLG